MLLLSWTVSLYHFKFPEIESQRSHFNFLLFLNNYLKDVLSNSLFDQRFNYNTFTFIISLSPMDTHDMCFQILFLESFLLQILQMLFFFWSWTHEKSFILSKLFLQISHLNFLFLFSWTNSMYLFKLLETELQRSHLKHFLFLWSITLRMLCQFQFLTKDLITTYSHW